MYTYVQCVQVYSHDILRYTGEGKPPRIVMLFTPDSDNTTLPDLKMITSFSGMKKNKIALSSRNTCCIYHSNKTIFFPLTVESMTEIYMVV